jgi:tetraacyldisaccharide 4'-kinase
VILAVREWLYRGGLLKPVELPAFVLSVGNLSLGGTGKSPFVMLLAAWATGSNISTGVLTRGYKRKQKNLEVVAPHAPLPEVSRLGDEPWMIKHRVPGISLLVHADRARMAKRHWAEFGSPKLVVLDDGFQHWRATRDRDVIMLDATESLSQGTFPFGRLRENAAALARADLVVINRAAEVSAPELANLVAEVRALARTSAPRVWKRGQAKQGRVICAQYEFDEFFDLATGEKTQLPAEKSLVLAAGVAKPDGVRALAQSLGLPVREEIYFPDHHRLGSGEVKNLRATVEAKGSEGALLLTEKDWARWRIQLAGIPGYGLRVRFRFLGDGEEVLADFLQEVAQCIT